MKYYLAVDIGASSGRHILGWLENGKLLTEEIYRFSNLPKTKKTAFHTEESLTWEVELLYSNILKGLKRAKEIGKIPYAVGIDTWGVDYALLDENDSLIDCVYCYRDHRTEKTVDKVHQILPFEKLYSKTGIAFANFNSIYQLYDDKLTGKLNNAKSMLNLPDYFHFLLTGVKKQEYTMATTTGMVNSVTGEWDKEIIEKLNLPVHLFTKLTKPGEEVGEFSKETQEIVGYNAKVILPATHDTASAVLAAPLEDQTPYISSGTWSLLGIEQEYAHTDLSAMKSGYSNEGSINGCFRLQKNIMGLWMIQCVKRELNDEYDFVKLVELAEQNAIDDKINVNDQRFLAPKSMIDEINSAVGRKLSVGELAYCVFDNLAEDYARSLSALEEVTGKKYDTLNIIGGGSKNQFLNKLTKQKTGKTVITGPTEGTAIGNLLMQMVGSGEIESVKAGRQIIKNSFDISKV